MSEVKEATDEQIRNLKRCDRELDPLWHEVDALIERIEQEVAERAHENDVGATDLEHKQIAQEGLVEAEAENERLRGLLGEVGFLSCSECGNTFHDAECCPDCHDISSSLAGIPMEAKGG